MTDTLSLIHSMRRAGLSEAQILAVIEEQAKEERERRAWARERDRLRKREERQRQNNEINQQSRPECPVDIVDIRDNPPLNGFNGFPHPSLTSLSSPKENPPKGGQKKGGSYPEDFEKFWNAYPPERRREKPAASLAWKQAKLKTTPEILMDSLARYSKTAEVLDGFAPYPAKWLKQERWNEDFKVFTNNKKPRNVGMV